MDQTSIQKFDTWRTSDSPEMDSIIGAARQFSQISGISLYPKGRLKTQGSTSFARFSARPKPLKWRGSKGWERVVINIRYGEDGASFMVSLDGMPFSIGPMPSWIPMKKAMHAIEMVHNKLKREHHDES